MSSQSLTIPVKICKILFESLEIMTGLHTMEQEGWLSLHEASEKMGVSAATLRVWADEGRVESYRTPGGHRRFRVGEGSALLRKEKRRGETRWRLLEYVALGHLQAARDQESAS